MPRFRRRLLALLTIGVIGVFPAVSPVGVFVMPAHAAAGVTFSATDIVNLGGTNTQDWVVTLSGLPDIKFIQIFFSETAGITVPSNPPGRNSEAFNTETQDYATCPNYPDWGGVKSGIRVEGKCVLFLTSVGWFPGSTTVGAVTASVGGTFSFKIAAGEMAFSSDVSKDFRVRVRYQVSDNTFSDFFQVLSTQRSTQQALTVTSTSGTFGTSVPLSTDGGSTEEEVTYAVANGTASGCAEAEGSLTSSSAGTCVVTATMAGNTTFAPVSSSPTTVTFAKASRTLSFGATTSYTISYGDTQQVTATPSPGPVDPVDGTVTYQVSSGSGCTVSSSGLIAVTDSEASCQVSASVSAVDNYLSASTQTPVSVTGGQRAITLTGTNPSTSYGTTPIPTTTVTVGSLLNLHKVDHTQTTFTFVGTGGTVYGPSTTLPTDAGTYSMTPSSARVTDVLDSTANYTGNYAISYQAGSLTIDKVSRSLSFTSPSSLTLQYGDTETVAAEPSVGDGVITYSDGSSTACSVNVSSGVVTVTGASGTCQVSATIAEGTNHEEETTSSPVTVTVSTRPITVSVAPQSVTVGGVVSSSPTVTLGALQLSDTLSSATFTYEGTGSTTYSASATAPTAVGTYSVTPSVAVFGSGLASNYVISYAAGTLEIVAAPPPVVASDGGGAAPAPEVVAPVETPRGPRNPRALPVTPNTSPLGQITQRPRARTDMNAPAGATIGGRPANLVVTPSGPGGVSLSAGSIQLGLSVNDSGGGNVQMDTPSRSPELVVPRGKSAAVSGGGLFPGSSVQLWLPGNGNDSREIARIPVRPDGTFSSEVTLEAGSLELPVPIGRQALAMVGFDEEGNETVIDITINVSQGVPAPEMNRQAGEIPGLSAGQSLATSAGMPETLSVTGIPDAGIVTMEGADWVMSLVVGGSNGSVENTEGTVLVRMGQTTMHSAAGSGFLPGTLVTVWLFSEPTLATTVTVDDNGEFSAEFLVDARLIAPGEHTLQIQGVGTDGYIKAANLGVLVEEPVLLTTESASGLLWWVAGAFLLALLLIVSLLVRRSRHS